MTRAMLMYEREKQDDGGNSAELEYYLLTDEVFFASNVLEIYGAEIKLVACDGSLLDSRRFRGLTPFGPRITELIARMAKARIEPDGMQEAVEELNPILE